MIKVLLCERSLSGHRKTYLEWLTKIGEIETYIFAPQNIGIDQKHFFKYNSNLNNKSIISYYNWIAKISEIVEKNKITVVHILDGDSIMRFCGVGFRTIKANKLIITYHHFFKGFVRKLSYKLMVNNKSRECVVHTESVRQQLFSLGVKNVRCCEYPAFAFDSITNRNTALCKKKFELADDVPVIGIVGGLNSYKNILTFLRVLQKCNLDFQLLICGKEGDISEKDIRNVIESYKEKATLLIRTLSDEEYEEAIVASDIIYCIYGRTFNGASGPLTDAVCAQKMIISCKHGSLGEITSQNLLGVIADCDDEKEILCQIKKALQSVDSFGYKEEAMQYREQLRPEHFQEKYKSIYLN